MVTEYGYLVSVANEMHLAYIERHNNPDKLLYAARLGCDTFRELLQDQAFFSDVAKLSEMRKSNEAEVDAIIGIETHLSLDSGEFGGYHRCCSLLWKHKKDSAHLKSGTIRSKMTGGVQILDQ